MQTQKKNIENQLTFPGFPINLSRNFWQYPRIMDHWWYVLSGSEQKVLDYILRHTCGFGKNTDRISMSQFARGILKKNGKQFDRGCGIKHRGTLKKAIDSLVIKGFILTSQKNGKTTIFQLKLEDVGRVVQVLNNTSASNAQVGSSKSEQTIEKITKEKKQNYDPLKMKSIGEDIHKFVSDGSSLLNRNEIKN